MPRDTLELARLVNRPMLFLRQPQIWERLRHEQPQWQDDPDILVTVRVYTRCGCTDGVASYTSLRLAGYDCDVLWCGVCGAWSLEVTY